MMKFILYPILLLIFVLNAVSSIAQSEMRETDWQFRTGSTLEYEINKIWSIDVGGEYRLKENFTSYDESLLEATTSYASPWGIEFHTIYRHYFIPDDLNRYRYTFGAEYDKYIGDSDWEWSVRARLQRENNYAEEQKDSETTWRVKFSVVYELNPRFAFIAEDELFYDARNIDSWDKNRLTVGIETELLDNLEMELFYRFENEITPEVSAFDHTIGLYFVYKIKWDRNKDESNRRFGHPYRW